MAFDDLCQNIRPLDEKSMEEAWDVWNSVAKPIGSLGRLEEIIVHLAGIYETPRVNMKGKVIVPFCADNGVVCEGVTQTGQEVTGLVAANMGRGKSSVCVMGRVAGATAMPVDMGMIAPVEGVVDRHIARGSDNIACGPAMTLDQAEKAVRVGVDIVRQLKEEGCGVIVTGEMGIGNTTTSAAVACALLGLDPSYAVGRGAGLSNEGLEKKIDAVTRALHINQPNPQDALDVLAKVGGFDIAGIAGAFIGGAIYRVPVLVDGFISAVGALVASRLCPGCRPFMIFSHISAEPAFTAVMEALGGDPVISAGMRLGEGTGAVCLLPMIQMALDVYSCGTSFDGLGIDAYEVDLK